MTDTNPPADRIAENARLLRKLELANRHRESSINARRELERKLIGWREAAEKATAERDAALSRVGELEEQLAKAREGTADMRAALERRLLQVKSFRSEGHKRVNPMLCTTPVTTVEEEIEDARLWWQAVKHGTETNEEAAPEPTAAPDSEMDPFEAADDIYRRWE
jgi:chromosome segregation ATPase